MHEKIRQAYWLWQQNRKSNWPIPFACCHRSLILSFEVIMFFLVISMILKWEHSQIQILISCALFILGQNCSWVKINSCLVLRNKFQKIRAANTSVASVSTCNSSLRWRAPQWRECLGDGMLISDHFSTLQKLLSVGSSLAELAHNFQSEN